LSLNTADKNTIKTDNMGGKLNI